MILTVKKVRIVLWAAVVLLAVAGRGWGKALPEAHDIPRMDKVVVDGKANDWDEGGFRVELLASPTGVVKPPADLDARVRLGWNDRGLLVLVTAADDRWIEHDKKGWMWRYDDVEMFLSPFVGSREFCQWVFSPGMTPKQPRLRWNLHDHRKPKSPGARPAKVVAARTRTGKGYVLEALLPWEALAIEPEVGRVVGFQIWVNDADAVDGSTEHAAWHPADNTASDPNNMVRLRLARSAGPAVKLRATAGYDWRQEKTRVTVLARPALVGKEVAVFRHDQLAAKAPLVRHGAFARAVVMVSEAPDTRSYERLSVRLADAASETPLPEVTMSRLKDYKKITDAELFAAMDLDRRGLSGVKAAAAKKDYPEAYRQWGRYFAKRTKPRWYVNTKTYGPGMKKSLPKLAEVMLARAQPAVDKNISHGGLRLLFRDGKPDWTRNPTGWTNFISLYNLGLIEPLGRAYLITGKAAYADAYRMYIRSLYEQRGRIAPTVAHGDQFWGSELNCGLRAMHLLDAYLCVRGYEGLTSEDHEAALKFLVAFAEILADHDRHDHHAETPNQRMAGMCSLGLLGIMLPEFRDSDEWRIRGVTDAVRTLKATVYPDGGHNELCTQYHMTVNRDPGKLSLAMALNGYRGGLYNRKADGGELFGLLHEWLLHAAGPDGFLPPYHSGVFATEWLAYLMVYEHFNPGSGFAGAIRRFGGPDYIPVAKGGLGDMLYLLTPGVLPKKGAAPRKAVASPGCTGVNLRPSGLGVMRSRGEATYLGTVYGKPVGGHGYPQLGSFVLYGAGKWLVLHPGSPFDYSDPDYEKYYHTTFSHNTVIVDGQNQIHMGGGRERAELGARCEAWVQDPAACILRITHTGYANLAGLMHTRTFFLVADGWAFIHDRLWTADASGGEHTFDWAVHTPMALREGAGRTLRGPGLAVVPARAGEIPAIDHQVKPCMLPIRFEEGLHKQQGKAHQYYLRKKGRGATYGVGLFPLAKGARAKRVRAIGPDAARELFEAYEVSDENGRIVILVRNAARGKIVAGGVSTTAAAAIARIENKRVVWQVESKKPAK